MILNYNKLSFDTKGRGFSHEFRCDVFIKSKTLNDGAGIRDITEYNLASIRYTIKNLKEDAAFELKEINSKLRQKEDVKLIRIEDGFIKRKKPSEKFRVKLKIRAKALIKYKEWLRSIKPESLIKGTVLIEKVKNAKIYSR